MQVVIPKMLRRRKSIDFSYIRDHIYLMHEFGFKRMIDGATYSEAMEYMERNAVPIHVQAMKELVDQAFGEVFIHNFDGSLYTLQTHTTGTKFMTSPAYFRYLEYLELFETRKNARSGHRWAVIALIVSGVPSIIALLSLF